MRRRIFKNGEGELIVRAEANGETLVAELEGGERLEGSFVRTGPNSGLWTVNGSRHHIAAAEHKDTLWAAVDGRVFRFELVDPDALSGSTAAENSVAAPMPGKVIQIRIKVGDTVEAGDPVIIVEAMKMEHTLRAPTSGTISEIRCEEGQQVDANVPLLEIETE